MLTIDELRNQLIINKLELDDEVIKQPVLFFDVSEQVTIANAERDAAKELLASTDADLAAYWRKSLSKNAKGRVTDTEVQQCVQSSTEHQEAFDAWLDAKTRAEKLQVLKDAFLQRSYMLRDLVTLYSANYYQDASVKPTKAQEASHYNANRARIANARTAKGRGS